MKPLIHLIQPPFVQLNCPYPGIYYVRAFLERQGYTVTVEDHSIGLFERIFCRAGLTRIFADAGAAVAAGRGAANRQTLPIIERFLSEKDRWLASIDRLVAFLRGQDREWGHLLGLANGILPGGPRFDDCLATLRDAKGGASGDASADDAPLLASKLLADIADFITAVLDPGFSLIRYVPSPSASLSAGFHDFSVVQAGLDSYILNNFYRPLLEEEWKNLADAPRLNHTGGKTPLIIGVTIPFPGCLAGALVCAQSAKAFFGNRVTTVAGGGYVNTELRFIEEENFFDYFDYLSFDRGYGSWDAILKKEASKTKAAKEEVPLYKTMYRSGGLIIRDRAIATGSKADTGRGTHIDDEAVQSVFPDYSGVDFSRYIRPVDNANPMHRLWSDGRWLKAYAAHGCYWHNCAFCDVSLDYIRCYRPVDVEALFRHLVAQAKASGVRGVHLVDEACPPASLLRLALLNREQGLPLVFWGNIRFEKNFTPDAAALLAAGGLIGVSAGIEVASERGFRRIGKGIGLGEVVNVCAAFKEAGILVHAYLIYGYWDEDDGEIIDSAETLRQLFAAGLLDSAFWHQFALTKHSRIYAEKLQGLHPALLPSDDSSGGDSPGGNLPGGDSPGGKKIFALNDLSFAGEERFDRFTAPLDALLQSWMKGDTSNPVNDAFTFKVPEPSVAPDLINELLDSYARERDRSRGIVPVTEKRCEGETAPSRALFLGSGPIMHLTGKGGQGELRWRWRLEDCALRVKAAGAAANAAWMEKTAALLKEASCGSGMDAAELFSKLENIFDRDAKLVWKTLRRQGLTVF
ncbi:radical SAM protein [Spirochaetia bacterium]|nr:radical SAM protein [Spirochaetia bacterium]